MYKKTYTSHIFIFLADRTIVFSFSFSCPNLGSTNPLVVKNHHSKFQWDKGSIVSCFIGSRFDRRSHRWMSFVVWWAAHVEFRLSDTSGGGLGEWRGALKVNAWEKEHGTVNLRVLSHFPGNNTLSHRAGLWTEMRGDSVFISVAAFL